MHYVTFARDGTYLMILDAFATEEQAKAWCSYCNNRPANERMYEWISYVKAAKDASLHRIGQQIDALAHVVPY